MTSERTQQTTKSNRGRTVLRRAVALASMLALTVPALLTTVAEPAGATTNFNVPALVNPSVGYDTGYNVVNSVTLTATGQWSQIGTCPTNCWGPNGTGGPLSGENQTNWLVPNGSASSAAPIG